MILHTTELHTTEQSADLELAIINPFLKTIISPWLIYIKCCLNWRQSTYKDINYMQSHYIFRTAVIENHSEEKSRKFGSVKEPALPYLLCETELPFFPQHICFYCNKVWFNNHHEYFIGRTLSLLRPVLASSQFCPPFPWGCAGPCSSNRGSSEKSQSLPASLAF